MKLKRMLFNSAVLALESFDIASRLISMLSQPQTRFVTEAASLKKLIDSHSSIRNGISYEIDGAATSTIIHLQRSDSQ
jgi:hypothetical protein